MGVYVARLGDECIRCHNDKLVYVGCSGQLASIDDSYLECPSCKAGFVFFYLTEEQRKQIESEGKTASGSVVYLDDDWKPIKIE